VPRSSDGLSEISRPTRPRYNINGRTLVAPLAAITMAGILFVYARTSIHAARLNAQRHREADGGQINWRNESMRRHGQLEKIDEGTLLKEALLGDKSTPPQEAAARTNAAKKELSAASEPARALDDYKRQQRLGAARNNE